MQPASASRGPGRPPHQITVLQPVSSPEDLGGPVCIHLVAGAPEGNRPGARCVLAWPLEDGEQEAGRLQADLGYCSVYFYIHTSCCFSCSGERPVQLRGAWRFCQAESAGQHLCPAQAEARVCRLHRTRSVWLPHTAPKGPHLQGGHGVDQEHRVVVGSRDTGGAGFVSGEGGPEGSGGATAHLPGLSCPRPFHPQTHSPPNSTQQCRKNWGGRKE